MIRQGEFGFDDIHCKAPDWSPPYGGLTVKLPCVHLMAKKIELELAHETYQEFILQAREAKKAGQFDRAIDLAMQCWGHVDSMMRYAQKYQDREFDSLECIDLVLELAPPLFHFEALDKLAALLKEQRRIDKQASADLAGKLAAARARMWEAHRVWNALESTSSITFDLGPKQRTVAKFWAAIGVCKRSPDGNTRLLFDADRHVRIKCSSCGATGKARLAKVLEQVSCPRCKHTVPFALLGEEN